MDCVGPNPIRARMTATASNEKWSSHAQNVFDNGGRRPPANSDYLA